MIGFTSYKIKQSETSIISKPIIEETGVEPEVIIKHTLSDVSMALPTKESYEEFHQKLGLVDFVTGLG